MTIGNETCGHPKLLHIREVKNERGFRWELQVFRAVSGNVNRAPVNQNYRAIELDFLSRINSYEQKSIISYMTSWSNQLYIADAGPRLNRLSLK